MDLPRDDSTAVWRYIRTLARRNTPALVTAWRRWKVFWLHARYRTPEQRFNQIFHRNLWGGQESFSGEGSSIETTAAIRSALEAFVREENVRTFLDLPCGDFNWMQHVELSCPYTGGDIVSELIERNKKRFGSEQRKFVVLNLLEDRLPQAELVLCRDAFNHFGFGDIKRAIRNLATIDARFFVVTHHPAHRENRDTTTGFGYRPLNFSLPPFEWGDPVLTWTDEAATGKSLAVWKWSTLRER